MSTININYLLAILLLLQGVSYFLKDIPLSYYYILVIKFLK